MGRPLPDPPTRSWVLDSKAISLLGSYFPLGDLSSTESVATRVPLFWNSLSVQAGLEYSAGGIR